MTSFTALIFNPVAQVKFVHTVAAGYTTASMFVLGISSWYLLKKRDVGFALRSIAVASGFGLASILSVIILGDESGYTTGEVQKVKLAAIEAEWHTEPAPAAFTVFGLPNQAEERTDYAIKIPFVLGLIATRSLDEQVTGLINIKNQNEIRVRNGMQSYADLQRLKNGYLIKPQLLHLKSLKTIWATVYCSKNTPLNVPRRNRCATTARRKIPSLIYSPCSGHSA